MPRVGSVAPPPGCARHKAPKIAVRVGDLSQRVRMVQCDTGERAAVSRPAPAVGAIYGLIDCAAIRPYDDWMSDERQRGGNSAPNSDRRTF